MWVNYRDKNCVSRKEIVKIAKKITNKLRNLEKKPSQKFLNKKLLTLADALKDIDFLTKNSEEGPPEKEDYEMLIKSSSYNLILIGLK